MFNMGNFQLIILGNIQLILTSPFLFLLKFVEGKIYPSI